METISLVTNVDMETSDALAIFAREAERAHSALFLPSETHTERKPHSVLPTGGWRSSEHPSPAVDDSFPKGTLPQRG